jgi:leader peptidase (prepilin peptidase) / N-methyltransferase
LTPADAALTITLLAIASGVLGVLVGSFLNVVIYRVPIGKSIVSPPSACPGCDTPIKGYDNIPVISWLLLRGKCRNCTTPISVRYPLVELGTGILFAATGWLFASRIASAESAGATAAASLTLIAYLYLAAISVALAAIDLDTRTLPNVIVLPAYIVGVALLGVAAIVSADYEPLIRALIGAAVLFVAYLLMALAYPGGMGLGDVKLAGVLGLFLAYLGWGTLIVGAFAAFLLGGIYAIALLVSRRAGRKSGIPFGPWMLGGAWVGIFIGEQAWVGYLGLVGIA